MGNCFWHHFEAVVVGEWEDRCIFSKLGNESNDFLATDLGR